MIRSLGVFMGHPQGGLECMWVGAGGEVGKSAYKINVSVYFSDLHAFLYKGCWHRPLK
jgi:hypothetical protein